MTVFLADAPAPGVDLSLFGQFAGSWELTCTDHGVDGSTTVRRGEWHFGYALAGRATTDVWILPGVEHRVSVRFPNPAAGPGVWRSLWFGPGRGRKHMFLAGQVEERIVLHGGDLRWTLYGIESDTFCGRNEVRRSDGEWRTRQEFEVWRR